ncbi:unnamed protein product [Durusdinium trenchii]|uniref:U-box domain-containing protein n=1 Tax=Durusdinium trenchii TaxID=1381693 RepID=A0ABP0NAP7_9DINO
MEEETPSVEDLVDPMPLDRPAKMRRMEEPGCEPSAPSTSPEKGISRADFEKILRMSQTGMSVDAIAHVWNVETVEIVKTLELMRSGKDSQSDAQVGSEHGWTSLVKRLVEDPPELCCPISHWLMEDPVVAADGITYERHCIAEWFQSNSGSPTTREPLSTHVLNPNQHVKSAVLAHKEKTVQEILSVASQVPTDDALKLLSRGEQFVRASLPDASAKRKLSSLLLFRGKRMLPGERRAVIEELVPMLLEVRDMSQLQELLADMDGQEVLWFLRQVDEDMIKSLSVPGPHKILVCKELARRITDSPVAEAQSERLSLLWDFLSQQQENQDDQDWAQAASLMLAAFHGRLTARLEQLDTKLLHHALTFLHSKESATAFARDFFTCDFGIFTLEKWPPSRSASIFVELASRMHDDKDEEKLDLLVEAHGINDSDAHVCRALLKQICRCMLCQRTTDDSKHLEGLLLKVQLEQVEDIPAEVVSKLCLEQESLKSLRGSQLMLLAKMLEKADRRADGARVAVAAAEAFSADGNEDESHGAVAFAHHLDRTNDDASLMLCNLLGSIRSKCKDLGNQCQDLGIKWQSLDSTCQVLGKRSTGLDEKYTELLDKYKQLQKAQEVPIKPPVWHLTWDLSGYDFTNFTEGQRQLSEEFQLGASGVEAWLWLTPKASADKASLYLHVSEPVWVKWRCQVGSWEASTEHEFAKEANGSLKGYGWPKQIPFSNLASGIAFHVLSVRRAGSSLRLVAPGS